MRTGFFIARNGECPLEGPPNQEKEGRTMKLTQPSPMIRNAGIMALLCACAQMALALGLFWALRANTV